MRTLGNDSPGFFLLKGGAVVTWVPILAGCGPEKVSISDVLLGAHNKRLKVVGLFLFKWGWAGFPKSHFLDLELLCPRGDKFDKKLVEWRTWDFI